jgi:hypothetical protein
MSGEGDRVRHTAYTDSVDIVQRPESNNVCAVLWDGAVYPWIIHRVDVEVAEDRSIRSPRPGGRGGEREDKMISIDSPSQRRRSEWIQCLRFIGLEVSWDRQ